MHVLMNNAFTNKRNSCKKTVLNIPSYSFKENEYILLAKGLKFIPSSKESNVKRLLLKNFDEFARKLTCKFSFDT